MDTLLLDVVAWDLTVDASGNIAVADNPYSIAQDVASEVRLFLGELWYDVTVGVPYQNQILGEMPSPQFMKTKFIDAGLNTPEVDSIVCYLSGITSSRQLTGQLQITDDARRLSVVRMNGELPWYISAVSPVEVPL